MKPIPLRMWVISKIEAYLSSLKFVFPAVSIRTMKKTNKTKETSRAKKV
jgi:hypothetical protein